MGGVPDHFDITFGDALEVEGIPTAFSVDLTHLPKIQLAVDPLTLNPIELRPITVNPLDVSVRLKEIPSVRGHVPANFTVGFSVFGVELAQIRLCGEAQVITEPYVPNPCERCEPIALQPVPPSTNVPAPNLGTLKSARARKPR